MFTASHFLLATSQKVHFIGIGGIGMSGIAEILLTMGYSVSGSDLRRSSATDRLESLGARIFEGHSALHTAASDVVVVSSAISSENPEVIEAHCRKIPVIQRAEMLAELMRLKYGIAVAGMHGKTTTTSMIAAILAGGGLDPTVVVGGRINALDSNARLGNSQYLIAEADESDRSFLKLSPILTVVTNLDREHMDCYRDMADVEAAFIEFMDKVPFYGSSTICIDNKFLRDILPRIRRKVYTYGESADADFHLQILEKKQDCHAHFEITYKGLVLGPFKLHVPGRHNLLNATAAIAIGVQLRIPVAQIIVGLASFRGVDRRFQEKGIIDGISVIDDYGHHPTEIAATLQAARECGYNHIHVLFQPHRYSRTRDLMQEFATSFHDADTLHILDIYAASEEPITGISSHVLVESIKKQGNTTEATYVPSIDEAVKALVSKAVKGDLILTLGAGNISQAGDLILTALRKSKVSS